MFKINIHSDNKKSNNTSFNNDFIKPKDFVTTNYDPYDLTTKINPIVEFLECSKTSFNISELEFSNMIPLPKERAIDSNIEMAIQYILDDSQVLLQYCSPIQYSGRNKERIKDVIINYIEEEDFDSYCDYFRKSDVRTDLIPGKRGLFRVIGMYLVTPKTHKKQKHSKHFLKVILYDPHHLFIPSKHDGMTAEENKSAKYLEVASYSNHIGYLL